MNVSVALASYNGSKYIKEQVLSIVTQLSENDEIVISDDGSKDNTREIILELMKEYPQIKLIEGPCKGVISNFENAIKNCSKDIIFLSDQDDVWKDDKVKKIVDIFETKDVNLILHNMNFFGAVNVKSVIKYYKGFIPNLIKSGYWGCCMAFDRRITERIIPFDKNVIAHDQWIGLIGELERKTFFLNEALIDHRIHSSNETKKLGIVGKIKFRMDMAYSIRKYLF